jgi:hypothetical protein
MTIEQLQAEVNQRGQLTRADVQEALNIYADPDSAYVNIQTFLDGIDQEVMTGDQKITVLNDVESYDY